MKSETKEEIKQEQNANSKQVGDKKMESAENEVAGRKPEIQGSVKVKSVPKQEANIVLNKKRRYRKRSKRTLNESVEKIEEIVKEKCEKQPKEVNCLEEEGNKKDRLIDKLKSNVELFETFEKFVKVFDDTKDSGSQKKKILNEIISSIAATDDKEGFEMLGILACEFKDMWSIRTFQRTYENKYEIRSHHFLDNGMSSNIYFGNCVKNGIQKKVAIKRPKIDFDGVVVREGMLLAQFDHENIIKLIAVSFEEPEIALEYMELGSLVSALRTRSFTDLNLLNVIKDVSSGMEYLHSKDYIHTDLACRNILVNSQMQYKICDFGSCVFVGYTNGEDLKRSVDPFTCMRAENIGPDVFNNGHLSKASDVWAMGILIYDMYERASGNPPDFFRHVAIIAFKSGEKRLERPSRCPKNIWAFLTEKMLNRKRQRRTTFGCIQEKCVHMLDQNKHDF